MAQKNHRLRYLTPPFSLCSFAQTMANYQNELKNHRLTVGIFHHDIESLCRTITTAVHDFTSLFLIFGHFITDTLLTQPQME